MNLKPLCTLFFNIRQWVNDTCSKMAVFEDTVCIRGDNDVQKLEVDHQGNIHLIKLFNNITSNRSGDIISDDAGDFWVSDWDKNIRKIPLT